MVGGEVDARAGSLDVAGVEVEVEFLVMVGFNSIARWRRA